MPGMASTNWLKQVRIVDESQILGELGTSLECKDRPQWVEWMRQKVGPTVKKAVSAHAVEGSEGQMGLVHLGREPI